MDVPSDGRTLAGRHLG